MKQGDKFPVTIAGQTVAEAVVREVGDGQVTLVVPGTIVVMATQTNIAPEATIPENSAPVEGSNKETIITGVDRVSGEAGTVEVITSDGGETPQPAGIPVTDPGETTPAEPQPAPPAPEPVPAPAPEAPTVSDNGNADAEPSA